MLEADYSMTEQAHTGRNRSAGDEHLLVRFYTGPRLDSAKTEEEGRPIYKDVAWIEIRVPGDRDTVNRPAHQMDYNRFPEHYRKYMARESQDDGLEGTLLEEWAGITRSQVEELRFFSVRTVEQLAHISDSNSQGVMGINSLREKAKRYLEEAKDGKAAKELEKANEKIAVLQQQMEELLAQRSENHDLEVEEVTDED